MLTRLWPQRLLALRVWGYRIAPARLIAAPE